jgi:hypothetical protein
MKPLATSRSEFGNPTGLEVLKRARVTAVPDPAAAPEEVPTSNIPALSPQRLQKITRSRRNTPAT